MNKLQRTLSSSGPFFIVLAAFLWGLDGILRRSLFALPPATIVFYEHLIGALLIAPFFFRKIKGERLTRGEWGTIVLVSVLSGVLGTLWFTSALAKVDFIPFSVVLLLQKLQPIFAVAAAALLLKERITRTYLGWAALALIAAYFVTFQNGIVDIGAGRETLVAAFLAVGAAFAWGTSTAFSRFTLLKHSHTFVTGLRFALTTLFAFGTVLALGHGASLGAPTPKQLGFLVAIALTTGMVALWIYYRGLKRTQAKISTVLELVFPLTAVFIDVFLYDTVLSPSQYIAAAVLIFAIRKVSSKNVVAYVSRVIRGRGRGKTTGFPTLNLEVPPEFTEPYGIYAGWVSIGDKKYKAAFHWGPVPVFDVAESSLEAHLLDTHLDRPPSGDVSFKFVTFLRDVTSFPSPEALRRQIQKDVEKADSLL